MTPAEHHRYPQALWYAWGQQDAGIGHEVDAFAFAYHHAQHAIWTEEGKSSHLPSIQTAWKTYVDEAKAERL